MGANLLPLFVGIFTICSIVTEVAEWVIPLVAVEHRKLRTMASKTANPISWPLPPCTLHRAVLISVTCAMQMRITNPKLSVPNQSQEHPAYTRQAHCQRGYAVCYRLTHTDS